MYQLSYLGIQDLFSLKMLNIPTASIAQSPLTAGNNVVAYAKKSGGLFTSITYHDSVLDNAILYNCTIRDSKLRNCRLSRCIVYSSTIKNCQVTGGQIRLAGPLKCTLINTKANNAGQYLQKLPAELRVQIFEQCLKWRGSKDNAAPPLLAALRGEPKMYFEALETFNRMNTFRLEPSKLLLCKTNPACLENMSRTAVARIRNLTIR